MLYSHFARSSNSFTSLPCPAFLRQDADHSVLVLELTAEQLDIRAHYAESIETDSFSVFLTFENRACSINSRGNGSSISTLKYNNSNLASFEAGLDQVLRLI